MCTIYIKKEVKVWFKYQIKTFNPLPLQLEPEDLWNAGSNKLENKEVSKTD